MLTESEKSLLRKYIVSRPVSTQLLEDIAKMNDEQIRIVLVDFKPKVLAQLEVEVAKIQAEINKIG